MWKLTIEDDQGNKTVVNLVRDEYSVGRAEDNTVRLTERNISRHHGRIFKQDSGWVLEDLASYNGCFVNGMRVGEPQHLEHGDLLQVGDYRLEVVDEAATQQTIPDVGTGNRPSTVPGVPRGHSLLGQPDRLVMLVGPAPGSEYPLTSERVVIGRGEECDVSINHGSVSRVHAEIRNIGNGRYELLDRGSANGLRINGVELERSLIDARDTIELGDVVLKYIPAGQIYRPGADESQQIGAVAPFLPDHFASTPGVEAHPPKAGLSPGVKVVAALGALGALMILGMVVVGTTRHGAGGASSATPAQQADSAAATLAAAKALLDQGQIEAAHAKALTIPKESNARQSADFREIEARWADLLLDRANQEADPAKKRALLDQVASTTSVDSVRRKRAANEIALLDKSGEGVDVDQLPSAPHAKSTAEPSATQVASSGSGIVHSNPYGSNPKKKKKTAKTHTTHTSHTASTAHTSKANEPNGATSGDRSQQTAVKNALKAKVASGKGTDQDKRLLRALCRQLGDMSCVN